MYLSVFPFNSVNFPFIFSAFKHLFHPFFLPFSLRWPTVSIIYLYSFLCISFLYFAVSVLPLPTFCVSWFYLHLGISFFLVIPSHVYHISSVCFFSQTAIVIVQYVSFCISFSHISSVCFFYLLHCIALHSYISFLAFTVLFVFSPVYCFVIFVISVLPHPLAFSYVFWISSTVFLFLASPFCLSIIYLANSLSLLVLLLCLLYMYSFRRKPPFRTHQRAT